LLAPRDRRFVVRRLTMPQRRTLIEFWPAWAHEGQVAPGDARPTWAIVAGRGFGKTRAGAEWVSALARRHGAGTRIALVGATAEDVRKVMVSGESGLLGVARTGEDVRFLKTEGVVRFASGAEAFVYSGACPEKLRGPQHHFAWCDEIAKWRHAEDTWDNLQLGLRLAPRAGSGEGPLMSSGPRTLVTTTPRGDPFLARLVEGAAVSRGRMADNPHLPPAFVAGMEAAYRGTRKGREELDGEMIADVEGALWSRALIERCRVERPHPNPSPEGEGLWKRIVVGVDPPASAGGDACGIVVCALGKDGLGYVLGDHSVRGLSPEGWAARVVAAAEGWGADRVVVEKNQGGDMVAAVLRSADAGLPVRPVHARFGKGVRAEPVAMLFETGRAFLAGGFPELEDELCALTRGGGYGLRGSPDRADAMVYALTELMLGAPQVEPRIRQL
jgi:phage terminase large subunit-like protein